MPSISKTYVVCLLISLLLGACGNSGGGGQASKVTVPPTPTGLQATALDHLATPSWTVISSATAVEATPSPGATVPPTPTRLQATAVYHSATPSWTVTSSATAVEATPSPGATVLLTPTGLQATAVDHSATPSWTVTSSATEAEATPSITPTVPLHAAFNTQGDIADLIALGFNLFDLTGSRTDPTSVLARVNALPEGTQALIWLGNMGNAPKGQSCPPPGFSEAEFKAQVDILANNPKVFGYNLADEPHPSRCPEAANAIKARSDYIHTYASGQKTYITILDGSNMCPEGEGCEYHALRPEITHVDLVGIDPYPCHFDSAGQPVTCDTSKISQRVQVAIANGIPISAIVPVFQAFGQEGRLDGKSIYYRTPTTAEFQDMLNLWKSLVPNPVFDLVYTWGIQCTENSCPAPQSLKNHPELQLLIKQHNLN